MTLRIGVTVRVASHFAGIFEKLKEHGLLLGTDARLPNVCALVAGKPVHGSWWAHPRSHDIFRVNCALAEHQDVLIAKLISGKVTYVDRALWGAVVIVASAREAWQLDHLSREARDLLRAVDRAPVQTDRRLAKAASELEKFLLVSSEQVHTETGAHARRLESWGEWTRRTGFVSPALGPGQAKDNLERIVDSLNRRFNARGRLPWRA